MEPQTTSSLRLKPNILRLMVDNAVDAQFIVDRVTDTFLAVNPAMCDLTGYSEEELLSKNMQVLDTVHPDDRAAVSDDRKRRAPEQAGGMRFRIRRKNGVERWVESRSRRTDYLGRDVHVGSARDITDQMQLERQLRQRLAAEAEQLEDSEQKARDVVRSNARLYKMVRTLAAIPQLTNLIGAQESVDEVVKQACLYLTRQDGGLGCARAAIWLRGADGLELAFSDPFRITGRLSFSEAPPEFQRVLSGEAAMERSASARIAPVRTRGKVIGLIEVTDAPVSMRQPAVGEAPATDAAPTAVFERVPDDDPVRDAQDNVIVSLADYLGVQLANIHLLNEIQQQVIHDPLTGLHNRRHFLAKLETEFRRAVRYNRALSLLVLDIDHFKDVNDTHSHPQGDLVLKKLGRALASSFRDLDSVCRIGGEEIAIIMPETPLAAAAGKAENIRKMIEALPIPMDASRVPHEKTATMGITVSIGAAALGPGVTGWEQIYQAADRALYEAKNGGRNRVATA
jgi:diguanylate cyclase (GGDEF)-like protein/PAS domain S-box-containing protein